ncbi:hypothetical protein ACN47E_006592 [Coniothyrium glycines]
MRGEEFRCKRQWDCTREDSVVEDPRCFPTLIAAAFLSSIGPDKYNYDLMASLTNNTAGSLRKMWPPVKKKAMEAYPSFTDFLGAVVSAGSGGEVKATIPKPSGGKKRKAADESSDDTKDSEPDPAEGRKSDGNKSSSKEAATLKGKGRAKKAKKDDEEPAANLKAGASKEVEDEV